MRALEAEVTVLARRLRRAWASRARSIHPDVQPTGYALLTTLYRGGAQRQTELCEELGLDKGAVSRQVNSLHTLGLVDREPDPDDRRAAQISLTDEARQKLQDLERGARQQYAEALQEWSAEEITQIADDLSRYNSVLENQLDRSA